MSLDFRISRLENEVVELTNSVDDLHYKIDKLTSLLVDDIGKKCDRMDDHISFVETVYENVKNPLGFLCHKINYMITTSRDYSYYLIQGTNLVQDTNLIQDKDSEVD